MTEKPTRIIRSKHDQDNPYYMMRRDTSQNKALSYEALGMLAYLLSKPDDWQVLIPDLYREGCKRDKTYRIIGELKTAGYIRHPKSFNDKHQVEWDDYVVYEIPLPENPEMDNPSPEIPDTEKPDMVEGQNPLPEIPDTEKPIVHSTESSITENSGGTEEKDSPAEDNPKPSDPIGEFVQGLDIPDVPEPAPVKKRIGDTDQEKLDIAVSDFFTTQYPPAEKGWGYLHMLGNFFTGKMKRDPGKKNQTAYFENQFDENPFDPAEIVGMIQWWFDENENELPLQKPATIAEKAGLFRISTEYNKYLKTGAERLKNKIEELNEVKEPESEKEYIPVEEAEAFMAEFHAELAELMS